MVALALLLAVGGFLLPFLLDWKPMFYDDIAFVYYPQALFLARSFQSGSPAWWDPYTNAGGCLFYTRFYSFAGYPLLRPFLQFADLAREKAALFWILKFPIALHYWLAALWAYFLGVCGLRLNRPGALALAAAYLLSPMMVYYVTFPPCIFVYNLLPALLLWVLLFARSGRTIHLAAGAAVFALYSTAGEVTGVIQVLTVSGTTVAIAAIGLLLRRRFRPALRLAGGMAAIVLVGFLLAGGFWTRVLSGIESIREAPLFDAEEMVGRPYSLHPALLATLLAPDWFGTVTGAHAWGPPYEIQFSMNDAALSGGLALAFLALLGLRLGWGRARKTAPGFWLRVFALQGLFGLVVVLGSYTPLHRIIRSVIPVFRELPYPLRWRVIECWAVSGLAGTAVSVLWGRPRLLGRAWTGRWTAAFLAFSSLALGSSSLAPVQALGQRFFPAFRHLLALGDGAWFVRGPLLSFLLAGAALALIARLPARRRLPFLLGTALAELLVFAVPAFYDNRILNYRNRDLSADRYFGTSDHPLYRLAAEFSPPSAGLYRVGYYRSYLDQVGWLNGSLSALGFDTKPLLPWYKEAVEAAADGLPNELWPRDWKQPFWANMSVRYLVTEKPLRDPAFRPVGLSGGCFVSESPAALPRVYFQDRWRTAEAAGEKEALISSDLAEEGVCSSEVWEARPRPYPSPAGAPAARREGGRILEADFSDPNRVVIEAEVWRPAMLVLTDVWHPDWRLTIAGRPETLHRVNFLQRGVWCAPGRHRLEMVFRPAALFRGRLMLAGGVAAVVLLLLLGRRRIL